MEGEGGGGEGEGGEAYGAVLRLGTRSVDEDLVSHTRGAIAAPTGGSQRSSAVRSRAYRGTAGGGVGEGRGCGPRCATCLGIVRAEAESVAGGERCGVGGEAEVHLVKAAIL